MKNNKPVGKLFSALVLGGAMMAQAQASDGLQFEVSDEQKEPVEICQVQIVETDYWGTQLNNTEPKKMATCVDGKTDEEILALIKEAKENSCISPFCGCWLG